MKKARICIQQTVWVKQCSFCPFSRYNFDNNGTFCNAPSLKEPKIAVQHSKQEDTIPTWCPLPEAD